MRKSLRLFFIFITVLFVLSAFRETAIANAMPFYALSPEKIVTRAKFSTDYSTSSDERKHNVELAAKALDKTFIDVGGEFSFNATVGERSERRGYKNAKIIKEGEFADGVGGGVCQVSTTLYNALLLADIKITEFHPHSLAVSYVLPSFDAMVSYGYADLKAKNNTKNPIIIYTETDGNKITVKICGQPLNVTVIRKSVITGEIPIPKDVTLID